MKIVVSCGFPYQSGNSWIHAEQQGVVLFVSKELLTQIKAYLNIPEEESGMLHGDHTAGCSGGGVQKKIINT